MCCGNGDGIMSVELNINTEVCTECMECTECCPTGALVYQEGFRHDGSKCSYCEVCSDVCPEQCLVVNIV